MTSTRLHPHSLCFALALVAAVVTSSAGTAAAQGIVNSAHDMSSSSTTSGPKATTNQICEPCHAPHNAGQQLLLWNHTPISGTRGFNGYVTMAGTPLPNAVNEKSMRCLGCHDGTVSVGDVFYTYGGGGMIPGLDVPVGAAADITQGPTLERNHPISIEWEHKTIDFTKCTNCHWSMPLPFYGDPGHQTMECPTCHEPHNNTTFRTMLRITPDRSEICYHCHAK